MRCLVVGCGSIGIRRLKLLMEMGHEVLGVDDNWEAQRKAAEITGISSDYPAHDDKRVWMRLLQGDEEQIAFGDDVVHVTQVGIRCSGCHDDPSPGLAKTAVSSAA